MQQVAKQRQRSRPWGFLPSFLRNVTDRYEIKNKQENSSSQHGGGTEKVKISKKCHLCLVTVVFPLCYLCENCQSFLVGTPRIGLAIIFPPLWYCTGALGNPTSDLITGTCFARASESVLTLQKPTAMFF